MLKLLKAAWILTLIFTAQIIWAKTGVIDISDTSVIIEFDKILINKNICVIFGENCNIGSPNKDLPEKKETIVKFPGRGENEDCEKLIFNSKVIKKELKVSGLKNQTSYNVNLFEKDKNKNWVLKEKLEFTSLASEPTNQSKIIIFKNTMPDEITLLWKKGNGSHRSVFVRKGREVELPEDGRNYKSNSNWGDPLSIVGKETYCVCDGVDDTVKITGLSSEEYFFRVFEKNGDGITTNYLINDDDRNPRSKLLPLPPPIVFPAFNISENGFFAKWGKVKNALYYEIDLATDEKFKNIVDVFNHMDIGDLDEMEFADLEPGNYYYRVTAVGNKNRSNFSNIIKVTIEKIEK